MRFSGRFVNIGQEGVYIPESGDRAGEKIPYMSANFLDDDDSKLQITFKVPAELQPTINALDLGTKVEMVFVYCKGGEFQGRKTEAAFTLAEFLTIDGIA